MKVKIITTLLIIAVLMLTVTTAFAAGGKERGDKAAGSAYQCQVMEPLPFQTTYTGIILYKTTWGENSILLYSR
jgi:hypothetical protein